MPPSGLGRIEGVGSRPAFEPLKNFKRLIFMTIIPKCCVAVETDCVFELLICHRAEAHTSGFRMARFPHSLNGGLTSRQLNERLRGDLECLSPRITVSRAPLRRSATRRARRVRDEFVARVRGRPEAASHQSPPSRRIGAHCGGKIVESSSQLQFGHRMRVILAFGTKATQAWRLCSRMNSCAFLLPSPRRCRRR